MQRTALTHNELVAASGASSDIVHYLYRRKRLPIARQSIGKGYPVLYSPSAIEVVKAHLTRNKVIIES